MNKLHLEGKLITPEDEDLYHDIFISLYNYLSSMLIQRKRDAGKAAYFNIHKSIFSRCKNKKATLNEYRRSIEKIIAKLEVDIHLDDTQRLLEHRFIITKRRINEENLIRSFGKEAKNQKELHYIYYYIGKRLTQSPKIRKASLVLNLLRKEASLFFFSSEDRRLVAAGNGTGNDSLEPIVEYYGDIKYRLRSTFLLFNKRKVRSEEAKSIPAQTCLDIDPKILMAEPTIIGAYVSSGPSVGICVISKVPRERVVDEILNDVIPPEIGRLLITKSYSLHGLQKDHFNLDKMLRQVQKTNKYCRTYEGFSITMNGNEQLINRTRWMIYDGYKVKYQSRSNNNQLKGFVSGYNDGTITIAIDYGFDTDQYGIHLHLTTLQQTVGLAATKKNLFQQLADAQALSGIYSMVTKVKTHGKVSDGNTSNKPSAGRVILVPTDKAYDKIQLGYINPKEKGEVRKLLQEHPYLEAFFNGEYDNYVEDPIPVNWLKEKDPEIPVGHSEAKPNLLKLFAGTYLTFRLSRNRKVVYQRPIEVYPHTNAVIRRLDFNGIQNKEETYTSLQGKITVIDDRILDFYFTKMTEHRPGEEIKSWTTTRHSQIRLSKRDGRQFNRPVAGQTFRLSFEHETFSFIEYFVRLPESPNNKPHPHSPLIKDWDIQHLPKDKIHAEVVLKLLKNPETFILLNGH